MVDVKSSGPGVFIVKLSQTDEYRLRQKAQKQTLTSTLCRMIMDALKHGN